MGCNTRDFDAWIKKFKKTIASYDFYVDFPKVLENANRWRAELHLMNSLLGSKNIEDDFISLVSKYPDVLRAVPILLAVRQTEILICEGSELTYFNFDGEESLERPQDYAEFMRATGLFDLMETHTISNLQDYVTGVEVGLDSNGRKNRGGHLMENMVESFLRGADLKRANGVDGQEMLVNRSESGVYYKELFSSQIQDYWDIDLSAMTNKGLTEKKFDFVVHTTDCVYGIEVNFYSKNGSKLNETARSYKELAQEAELIDGFKFVWVTDGGGWGGALSNLRETFEILETIYNLDDLEHGAFKELFS